MKAQYYVSLDEGDVDFLTYGPYALKSAKDFARIGSQHGGDRAVTRGELGPLVRIYSGGERVWPSEPKDADVLRKAERPGSFPNPGVDYSKRLVGVSPHGGLLYAQGPTIMGVEYCNALNETADGGLMAPLPSPENAGYIGMYAPEKVEKLDDGSKKAFPAGADYFAQQMTKLGVDADRPAIADYLGWRNNPREVAHPDDCIQIFADVRDYLTKRERFTESWNTHENAQTAVAYAVWSLMAHARVYNLDYDEMFGFVCAHANAGAGDFDVMDGVDDLWEMWDDFSPWHDVFGFPEEVA